MNERMRYTSARVGCDEEEKQLYNNCRLSFALYPQRPLWKDKLSHHLWLVAFPIILNRAGKQIRGPNQHSTLPSPPIQLTIASQVIKKQD
jgi:hypothetical protein